MAEDHQTSPKAQLATASRWSKRRRTILRRRKLPSIRLGGGNKQKRGFSVTRVLRRMKMKWLRLKYMCMIKKLKEYYKNLIKDIVETGASIETFQQRLLMEASLSVPVMGLNYPTFTGSDRPRSLFM